MSCRHENFNANVSIGRLTNKDGNADRFQAEIRVNCIDCGEPFKFLGLPTGLDLNSASVSVDGFEARMAIGTDATVASILDEGCTGFTVRRIV
jgi:hypothetical protein